MFCLVVNIWLWFIAHLVNLSVKDYFIYWNSQANQFKSLSLVVRSSVKMQKLPVQTKKQLGLTNLLPNLDFLPGWHSTFQMINNAIKPRSPLESIKTGSRKLPTFVKTHDKWMRGSTICNFLKSAASLTECQWRSCYATVSMILKTFKTLVSKHFVALEGYGTMLA